MEIIGPASAQDHWLAADRHGAVEVRFVGRGPLTERPALLAAAGGTGLDLAWVRQTHSDLSLEAAAGDCGEADALTTGRPGLALSVATADCVPVVVAGADRLAAIHAGWRGIASAIVPKTLTRLAAGGPLVAWLGPAIGPCCYEVGRDVADRVTAASAAEVAAEVRHGKPHLDLHAAIALQLRQSGVTEIRRVETCTRCHPESLWSYRRDGQRAGRNLTFAWLSSDPG